MLHVHVLVATRSRDLAAELISAAVARSTGMVLLGARAVAFPEVEDLLGQLPPFAACALVLVGPRSETQSVASRWLRRRRRLVVVQVDSTTDIVQLTARDVGMEALLAALRDLLDRTAPWAALHCAGEEPRAKESVQLDWSHKADAVKEIVYPDRGPCPSGATAVHGPTRPTIRHALRTRN